MSKRPLLDRQVAAVTGGARGIGRSTAEALVRQGAAVAIGDVDVELATEVADALGEGVIALPLDVTRRDAFEAFLDETERRLGPLEVLVNNAGIMPLGRFAAEPDSIADRIIDINLRGVILGTKIAISRMAPRRRGHIVNVSSQAGKAGLAGGATYSATKHAVVGLSEAVRAELRGTGIEISCVMPAAVNTELVAGVKEARGLRNVEPEQVADAIVDALETRRFEVWVPRMTGHISRAMSLVPRRGREAIVRAFGADRLFLDVDTEGRAGYEIRARRTGDTEQSSIG